MIAREYKRRAHAATGAVAAIALAYLAQTELIRRGDLLVGVVVFALAGALALRSFELMDKLPDPPISRGWTVAAMTAILLLGAGMRLWDLASIPQGVWFDEAQNGLVATRILTDPGFKPIYVGDLTQLPALFFYWMAGWIALVGSNVLAVRLASAAVGILTIPGLYLVGRELFGQRVGLIAAFLLALSRWHLNFSRFGMSGIAAPFFLIYAVFFLARGIRTGRPRDFVLGGLAVGLGLNTYLAFNAVPALLALWIAHRLLLGGRDLLRERGRGLGLAVVVAFLAFAPLAVFALTQQQAFLARTETTSLFTGKTPEQARAALATNVVRHVEMFNVVGDPNGRHNLAGSPELDDGTAALFVLGLVIALSRWRRPNYLLLALWLAIMLLPGILSLDFEAPQSYRSIGVVPVIALLAALPVAYATRVVAAWLGRVSWRALNGLAVVGLLAIGWANFHVYWFDQIWDNATWSAFSTQATLAAREVDALGPGYQTFLDPILVGQPTLQFLAPSLAVQQPKSFDPAVDLPLRVSGGAAIFVGDLNLAWMDAIHRDYPRATFQAFRVTPNAPAILYAAIIPKEQVDAAAGVVAAYAPGTSTDAKPAFERQERTIDVDWRQGTPIPPPFVVDWTATLVAPTFGDYGFRLDAPAGARLKIDENDVASGGRSAVLRLAQGTHRLEVDAPIADPTQVRLWWQPPGGMMQVVPANALFAPPVKSRGLLASYYPNDHWSGPAATEAIDPEVSRQFHLLPLPQPFTVEWTGKIDIPTAGIYRFGTQSIDYSWLSVDGKLVVDNSREEDHYGEGAVSLSGGLHDIAIRFVDRSGFSFIDVYWTPPGGERTLLPGDRLFPPQGSYPERAGALAPPTPFLGNASAAPPAPAGAAAVAPAPVASGDAVKGPLPVAALGLSRTVGAPGDGPDQLKDSRGVAVDAKGDVYVADSGHKVVKEYDPSGKLVATIGGPGQGDGQFVDPTAVALDVAGNLLVLDGDNGWIQRFGPDGRFVNKFGGPGLQFYHPRGLAVDPVGNVYVADTGSSRIVVFNPAGELVKKLGERGKQPGQLTEPVGIAVTPDGLLYVTDTALSRLTLFDASFTPIRVWTIPTSPSVEGAHVALAPDGGIYVTDPDGHRVVHYDPQGKPLDQLGTGDQLRQPVGIWVGPDGSVYVADAAGGNVAVFAKAGA